MDFVNHGLLKHGFISASDLSLFKVFHNSEDALDHIQHFYRTYHSMRLVKDELVIRLKRELTEKLLKDINEKFNDLSDGPIRQARALPEESNEPEFKDLSRLVFTFDHRDYGQLRRLIDYINDKAI
jgi:hypothetical protein